MAIVREVLGGTVIRGVTMRMCIQYGRGARKSEIVLLVDVRDVWKELT